MWSCISHPRPALAALGLALLVPTPAWAGWRCLTPQARAGLPLAGPTLRPGPIGPPATDTCWGQQAAYRLDGAHVAVEYDDAGLRTEALALRADLDAAYEALTEDLGWPEVAQSDQYLLLAYIDSGDGGGAYTTTGRCADGTSMPYMVVFADVFDDPVWVEDMAAHELNHFQQFSLGVGHEDWWYEATATWIQDQVNPLNDTWLDYVDRGYLAQPQLALRASRSDAADFAHMYGMALFAAHLSERVDGPELVKRTWTEASAAVVPLPELLEDMGYNFDGVYRGFVVSAATGRWDHASEMGDLSVAARVTSLPAEGVIDDGRMPENLGQAFLRVAPGEMPEGLPDLGVRVAGEAGGDWRVFLIGVAGGEAAEVVEVAVAADGTGAGQLPGMAAFEHAWVVVTPTAAGSRRAFSFSWAMEAVAAAPEDTAVAGGDDTGLEVDGPRSEPGGGPLEQPGGRCSSGGLGAGWLWGLGLLIWRRRAFWEAGTR
ncbi:MAG: hypothetical protein H6741_08755 [Alphaproteobacteria bacterium]|nr:hypothetical protein [Alphaproteobacteria bacterium]MCB9792806.1 hypothetical protein [Alphaproteobacteria bacterium]